MEFCPIVQMDFVTPNFCRRNAIYRQFPRKLFPTAKTLIRTWIQKRKKWKGGWRHSKTICYADKLDIHLSFLPKKYRRHAQNAFSPPPPCFHGHGRIVSILERKKECPFLVCGEKKSQRIPVVLGKKKNNNKKYIKKTYLARKLQTWVMNRTGVSLFKC